MWRRTRETPEPLFRQVALANQRNIMPSWLLPIYLPIAIVLSLMGVFGILKNLYFVMPMVCYQFCMILCVSGILARRQTDNSEKLRRGERICFGAMLVGAPAFHLTALLMSTGMQEADLILIGTTACWKKMFFVVMYFSDLNFWILNLSDTAFWLACTSYKCGTETTSLLLTCAFSYVAVAWLLRLLAQDTLEAAYQEAQRRAAAEGDLKRFISYIMHETRNPLSALMLLVGSFQDTLRHMISVSASKRKHRGGKNKTLRDKRMEAARVWNHDQGLGQGGERALPDERPIEAPFLEELHRMEGLNLMMMTKLTKMQTVCDDVLQLQKLELGHLTYSFRGRDLREWGREIVAEAQKGAELFDREKEKDRGSRDSTETLTLPVREGSEAKEKEKVTFEGEWVEADPETSGFLDSYQWGVADFGRLNQVIENFLGNSRNFTKTGTVCFCIHVRRGTEKDRERFEEERIREASNMHRNLYRGDRKNDIACAEKRLSFSSLPSSASPCSSPMSRFSLLSPSTTTSPPSSFQEGPRSGWAQWVDACISLSSPGARQGEGATGSSFFGDAQEDKGKRESRQLSLERFVVLRVSVKDTGPGMTPEEISKLFKPYSQIRAGELQNGKGTGLGLLISKSFVEAHGGGRIWAQSDGLGLGSLFCFEIFVPLLPASTKIGHSLSDTESVEEALPANEEFSDQENKMRQEDQISKEKEGKREEKRDEEKERSSQGHEKHSVSWEGEKEEDYEEEKGEEEAEEEEAEEDWEKGKGEASVLYKTHTREHRGDEWGTAIPPPLGDIRRESTPPSCLVPRQQNGGSEAEKAKMVEKDKPSEEEKLVDVLVVDDDFFCLTAAKMVITQLGYTVMTVTSGEEAVQVVTQQPSKFSFRLLLVDNNMGGIFGPEAITQIREFFTQQTKTEEWATKEEEEKKEKAGKVIDQNRDNPSMKGNKTKKRCPLFIGCTGETSAETEANFIRAGAVRVLHKPIRKDVLRVILSGLDDAAVERGAHSLDRQI